MRRLKSETWTVLDAREVSEKVDLIYLPSHVEGTPVQLDHVLTGLQEPPDQTGLDVVVQPPLAPGEVEALPVHLDVPKLRRLDSQPDAGRVEAIRDCEAVAYRSAAARRHRTVP